MTFKAFKSTNPILVGLILAGTTLAGFTAIYTVSQVGQKQETPPPVETTPVVTRITALGRLEPRTEIISVSAPLNYDSDRMAQLFVDEGDTVKQGQVIAILDSRDRLQNNLTETQKDAQIARAKLAQVKAGAKTGEIEAQSATVRRTEAQLEGDRIAQQATLRRTQAQLEGDIAAQQATIGKLEAEYNNANAEFIRYQQLYNEGAISASNFDAKKLSLETSRKQLDEAKVTLNRIQRTGQQQIKEVRTNLERIQRTGQQQINEAQSTLNKVAEVRSVDVQAAQAEVDSALAKVQKAQTELNQVYIRSPLTGQVINVHTRPGEQISDDGVVDLAQTGQMEVVAEIYQSDISKIRTGQEAIITGESFEGEVRGNVRLIGLQVDQQKVFSNQPGENLDRRIIEVRISVRPEDVPKVRGLTNSQVQVAIKP
ncbi:HlyD family efflux transporter periplasmic adaptor subunit [Chroococcus sp. FPU101]|uniref:HlyD family efflux transporter periplasmic adaptor subunit n=1 Tax=Chroococcus sp. FPU101 TaxID=1974212 RepID=UPI001A8F71AB|nr:efflux RND transporter periplasmic adaptor subunit [Chroococcus sp. FPU101]GFE70699.1 ABC-transporter DevB family protein [Chroococcus sp. FPU101]